MSRARVLSAQELRQLLLHVSRRRHALRNATQLLLTYWAGLRVSEVAALRYSDVLRPGGGILPEVSLSQGAGRPSRVVLISARMQRQLLAYVNAFPPSDPGKPLFFTQKSAGWTANTLTQHFFHLYRAAGLRGASSQSGRRTFVTALVRQGVATRTVQALAGHRRAATTRAVVGPEDLLRIAIEGIDPPAAPGAGGTAP